MDLVQALDSSQEFSLLLALLGAIMAFFFSVIGSLLTFHFTRKVEEQREGAKVRSDRRNLAILGFSKLISNINRLDSLNKAFDSQFDDVNNDGHHIAEPALAIVPIVGVISKLHELTPEEYQFLFLTKFGSLVTEIQIVQARLEVDLVLVAKFNEDRENLSEFLMQNNDALQPAEGPAAQFRLSESNGRVAEIKIGALNRILAEIVECLPSDLGRLQKLTRDYRDAAAIYFGADFPKIATYGAQ